MTPRSPRRVLGLLLFLVCEAFAIYYLLIDPDAMGMTFWQNTATTLLVACVGAWCAWAALAPRPGGGTR